VEEAFDLVATQAAEKHLEMAYSIDEQTPTLLLGDVTRLRQVLVNLLSNAVKFTQEGEVVVTVTSRQQDMQRYEIQIAVRDTGIGISQSHKERLFQSFTQGDTSVTRRYGGTGLGLAISKMLVELMGGHIHVESVVREGTTFHFTIAASTPPGQQPHFTDHEISLLEGQHVLIVDDNATNRLILARQVQAWQMKPHLATSGPEALQLLQSGQSFNVAILDVQMPDMDGITLAQHIRAQYSPQELPIVVLTSVGKMRGQDTEHLHLAATLSKPLKPSQLHILLLGLFSEQPAAPTTHLPAPSTEPPQPALSLRILLAEDNAVNQKVALRLLARLGYRADIAANGLEVLEALARQRYDVVLMDAQMPEMDGVAATAEIRKHWSAANQPRIVAMTADALVGSREYYLSAGMDDYISKPVRRDELAAALLRCQEEAEPPHQHPASDENEPAELPPAIDEQVISELLESIGPDGKEFLQEIIDAFFETAPTLLNDMRQAIAHGDSARLYRAAHTLKPGGGSLGATGMASLCGKMEALSHTDTLAGTAALLDHMEVEYQRVKTELATIISHLPDSGETEP
jgi:CheY-like chemotaxis protein/HPt (histidine-containing phosphotransfer) domain-containing protein